MTETTLVPSNATAFELAQSATDAARWPLPADLIKTIWNPWTCPLDLLPYLAAGLGLEIWHDDWSEQFRRQTVANLWALKRNKTKLKGIIGYAALEGASVVAAHRPRDKRWWTGGQSDAQRLATIAEMPQIHIATVPGKETAPYAKAFWSGRSLKQFWRTARFTMVSDAQRLYEARATYVDQGVSTPITVTGIDGPLGANWRVALSAKASVAKAFYGAKRFWGACVYQSSDADAHVISITPDSTAATFAVPSGLVPMNVRPQLVADVVANRPGQRFWGSALKAGLSWGGGYGIFRASDADLHIYQRIVLFDPSRATPSRQPYSFWGYSRWGRPFPTAQIKLAVTLTRPPLQQGWGRPWGRNFWRKSDMSPLWRALTAVATALAYRDFVYIDFNLYAQVSFTAGLRFGDATFKNFGDWKKLT